MIALDFSQLCFPKCVSRPKRKTIQINFHDFLSNLTNFLKKFCLEKK